MNMDDELLRLLDDYPPYTACIAYELPLCRGLFHWFVGAAPTDDALSLAAHLAIHKPNARMVGWANNRRAPAVAWAAWWAAKAAATDAALAVARAAFWAAYRAVDANSGLKPQILEYGIELMQARK